MAVVAVVVVVVVVMVVGWSFLFVCEFGYDCGLWLKWWFRSCGCRRRGFGGCGCVGWWFDFFFFFFFSCGGLWLRLLLVEWWWRGL